MELILETSREASLNIPKLSLSTFEMKNNYYVVTDGQTFNYFPIKVADSPDTSPLIRFVKAPPILMEGVAIVNKKKYHVTLKDLQRSLIRKSRLINQEAIDASNKRNATKNSPAVGANTNPGEAVLNRDEQPVVKETEVEINEAADAAWSDQIGSLLSFISEKEGEEWEITDAS